MLRKIGIGMGAAFAVPLLASFSKDGLIVTAVQARQRHRDDGSNKKGGHKKGSRKK
jgi:hypothetical protein